jgi:hypothetical protein
MRTIVERIAKMIEDNARAHGNDPLQMADGIELVLEEKVLTATELFMIARPLLRSVEVPARPSSLQWLRAVELVRQRQAAAAISNDRF